VLARVREAQFDGETHSPGKYLVLFFYPLDFTFVCPTELLGFSDRIKEFHDIQTEVTSSISNQGRLGLNETACDWFRCLAFQSTASMRISPG